MAERPLGTSHADGRSEERERPSGHRLRSSSTKKALEIVAMRGAEVIGVRHLLVGARAWIGNPGEPLARISMEGFGGAPMVVAEVTTDEFIIHVPPYARARTHRADGLGRLARGPETFALVPGDRTVILLGSVQIRAQVVPIETLARGRPTNKALRWIAAVGTAYVAALAFCAWLTPANVPLVAHGSLRQIVESIGTEAAAAVLARESR